LLKGGEKLVWTKVAKSLRGSGKQKWGGGKKKKYSRNMRRGEWGDMGCGTGVKKKLQQIVGKKENRK